MEIVYNKTKAKKCYKEVNSIRKGFTPQTLMTRDKEGAL
jgi:hypothetical protein